jgi:hypothetical protein
MNASNASTDAQIARIAIAMWILSTRKIETLPTVRVCDPYQTVNLVPGARAGWGSARDPYGETSFASL